MVYIEIIDTLQLLFSIGIFLLVFLLVGNFLSENNYKPQPMDEHAKRMYS